ncbi:dipeptidase PepE [Vreelandella sp. EE7]
MSRLLLLSSSRAGSTGYLDHAKPLIGDFLGDNPTPVKRVLFVPFAGVGKTFDDYLAQVRPAFEALGLEVEGIHQAADAQQAVRNAEAIAVGGGNTFALVKRLYEADLLPVIQERVAQGLPYMGWSAGSNIAGPTLCTTNDMPIVEPPSFKTLGLVPFQLNPHFLAGKPAGHNGESREERLSEYLALNPQALVVGLREGTALRREGESLQLLGELDGVTFSTSGQQELAANSQLDHLLTRN